MYMQRTACIYIELKFTGEFDVNILDSSVWDQGSLSADAGAWIPENEYTSNFNIICEVPPLITIPNPSRSPILILVQ